MLFSVSFLYHPKYIIGLKNLFEYHIFSSTPLTNPTVSPIHIQIMFDLHLEAPAAYDTFEITPQASVFALPGDIGQTREPGYLPFLARQLYLFRTVLLVFGNHEP